MVADPAPRRVEPHHIADAREAIRHVFVRDLVVDASIGVYSHEREAPQRVRVNVDLAVREQTAPIGDDLANVVSYEDVTKGVEEIVGRGHINLVETLADEIAELCLADPRVRSVRVRVEKLDVFPNAESVGVEIERFTSPV